MTTNILQELAAGPVIAARLEDIEQLVRVATREAGRVLENMKGSALTYENFWRRIVLKVADGHTAEVHAERAQWLSVLEDRLALLKQTHALVTKLDRLNEAEGPNPDVLIEETARLQHLKANVFDRWQTAEDLEDLAAKDYPLNTADLDQLGPQRRPAASYFAGESKPF